MAQPADFTWLGSDPNWLGMQQINARSATDQMESSARMAALQAQMQSEDARNAMQQKMELARLNADSIRMDKEIASRQALANTEAGTRSAELSSGREFELMKYFTEAQRRENDPETQLNRARLGTINAETDPTKKLAMILGKPTDVSPDTKAQIASHKELAEIAAGQKVSDDYTASAKQTAGGEIIANNKYALEMNKLAAIGKNSDMTKVAARLEATGPMLLPGHMHILSEYSKQMKDSFVGNQNMTVDVRDKYMWDLSYRLKENKQYLDSMLEDIKTLSPKASQAAIRTYNLKSQQFQNVQDNYNYLRDKMYMKNANGQPATADDIDKNKVLGGIPFLKRPWYTYASGMTPSQTGWERAGTLLDEAASGAGSALTAGGAAKLLVNLFKSPQELAADKFNPTFKQGEGRAANNVGMREVIDPTTGKPVMEPNISQKGTPMERNFEPSTRTDAEWKKFYDKGTRSRPTPPNVSRLSRILKFFGRGASGASPNIDYDELMEFLRKEELDRVRRRS